MVFEKADKREPRTLVVRRPYFSGICCSHRLFVAVCPRLFFPHMFGLFAATVCLELFLPYFRGRFEYPPEENEDLRRSLQNFPLTTSPFFAVSRSELFAPVLTVPSPRLFHYRFFSRSALCGLYVAVFHGFVAACLFPVSSRLFRPIIHGFPFSACPFFSRVRRGLSVPVCSRLFRTISHGFSLAACPFSPRFPVSDASAAPQTAVSIC